ncbi:MAG: SHOCT domain-containing protein, partial [Planctomycetota bacterium]|nr:SHOCT domain-containing protein [Planctomycetota bacterium]
QRHGVSNDAVTHMLIAIQNGNGSMAQFNHPEFGGCGQWMRGGMTMVSDLFNHQLKFRVDSICNDIANELGNHQLTPFSGSFQSQSQNGAKSQMQAGGTMGSGNSLFVPDPEANWWPQDLGAPNALGSQNHVRYAYFANSRRLAVKTGSDVWVYDTKDHQIGGFSQQQGIGGSITFTSQYGTVNLSTLPVIARNGITPPPAPVPAPQPPAFVVAAADQATGQNVQPPAESSPATSAVNIGSPSSNSHSIIETLERLGGLRDKGYVSEEEFAAKKSELLSRL